MWSENNTLLCLESLRHPTGRALSSDCPTNRFIMVFYENCLWEFQPEFSVQSTTNNRFPSTTNKKLYMNQSELRVLTLCKSHLFLVGCSKNTLLPTISNSVIFVCISYLQISLDQILKKTYIFYFPFLLMFGSEYQLVFQ